MSTMKILIVKRGKIGDLLLTTPMLRHLRASPPDAQIHLLANDYNAWVVAGDDEVVQPVLEESLPFIHPFRGPILPALGLIWQQRTP